MNKKPDIPFEIIWPDKREQLSKRIAALRERRYASVFKKKMRELARKAKVKKGV